MQIPIAQFPPENEEIAAELRYLESIADKTATVRGMTKLDQAQAYARRLGLRDAHDRFPRDDSGVIWSAEKITRKQFAHTDQNSILRAYRQGRIAGSADNPMWTQS